ncbi:hypothetical protein [Lacticaseibacillus hulanensis]|uniref:hypothetical protein n=1 Tax=Lacticaseibacillus hulanensis TaxID=2493111 RepID=UPI000FDA5AE8|nr:hypothetical protein [Lacticaseibacillus hulanensis]
MQNRLSAFLTGIFANAGMILFLAGAASLVYAGFIASRTLGYAALGLALIVVAYIVTPEMGAKR